MSRSSKRWIPMSHGDLTRAFRERRASKRQTVFVILGIFAVIGWLYVFFISDFFIVHSVQVEGIKNLDPVDVNREVLAILDSREGWRPWPKRHLLFINTEELKTKLNDRLFVANVTVDKKLRNVLRLKIEERAKRFVLHSKQQYAWIDLQGVVTDELTLDEKKNIQARLLGQRVADSDEPPVIKRNLNEMVSSGYSVFSNTESKKFISVSEQLMGLGLAYREIEPPGASSTLMKVLGPQGQEVLMDVMIPLDLQVRTYLAFIQAKPKGLKNAEYIDVRVPGRVYLKEK